MIKLIGIDKIYKGSNKGVETKALQSVNLEITEGDFCAIMGTSGSGKSTLLNILGGMDVATSGKYYYRGQEIQNKNKQELAQFRRDYVSFVFQHYGLINQYDVYENVEIPLLAQGISRIKRKEMVMEQLEKLGMCELARKNVTELSGGQRQKCAIARAMVSENELILADEPTGALDRASGQEIMRYLVELNNMGKTVILVTHDLEIASYAKNVIYIDDGKIKEEA